MTNRTDEGNKIIQQLRDRKGEEWILENREFVMTQARVTGANLRDEIQTIEEANDQR